MTTQDNRAVPQDSREVADPGVITVDESGVLDFARLVTDPNRRQWIVVASSYRTMSGERPLLDMVELARRINGRAIVAVLDSATTAYTLSGLSEMEGLAVWGGAVRLLEPGARAKDTYPRHPVIRSQPKFLDVVYNSLEKHLEKAAPDLAVEVARLRAQVAEKDRTILQLRQDVRKLSRRSNSSTPNDDGPVWSDPEKQLAYEIGEAWLRQVAEYDRDGYPLPEKWLLGVDFLVSLAEMSVVSRDVVVATIVDVLTGRAATISGRYLHMHRRNSETADQLVRHDGAAAWRCAVRQAMPSAPRLMWWRLPDGTIELGRVALHNDNRLR